MNLSKLTETDNPDAVKYLRRAYEIAATESHDLQTQTGSILVCDNEIIGSGANSFPKNVTRNDERLDRSKKLFYMEHAERNSIFAASRRDLPSTKEIIMYCPWYACADCARAMIQFGVNRAIGHRQIFEKTPDRWVESIERALEMLLEAGVKCELYSGKLDATPILFDGKLWEP